ncbi:MAG: hypothetical protein K5871_02840 [Lachnospiraceae bacterium]|nr:hypothetical protein [Lachnospiraceae bacterium]
MDKKASNFIFPLITQKTEDGVRFCLETSSGDCGIVLYDLSGKNELKRISFDSSDRIGNLYCKVVNDIDPAAVSYLYHIDGKLVSDSRALGFVPAGSYGEKTTEPLKALICKGDPEWEDDVNPCLTYEDSFWYLLHVRGFTRSPSSGVRAKGTFEGITEKLDHLESVGITTIELQPAYEFNEWDDETGKINYWGYKPGFYYTPKRAYSYTGDPAGEFRNLVKALHRRRMEICMQFYFAPDFPESEVLEILRFWVVNYHIDAFHLMGVNIPMRLLAADSLLAGTKLLSDHLENVDFSLLRKRGKGRVIGFYADDFQFPLRRLIKSDDGQVSVSLSMLRNNPEDFGRINFLSSYRGFTLMDMVSYDRKHNEENGEEGRDGSDMNFSWNCGEEGPTRKKKIRDLRLKQIKNAYSILMMGAGTPLIFMGDEFGNSQKGNNNPYCIDSQVTWLDWKDASKNTELTDHLKALVALRNRCSVFRKNKELYMIDTENCGFPEISYHSDTAWKAPSEYYSRSFGIMYCEKSAHTLIYAAVNMNWEEARLALPKPPKGCEWELIISSDHSSSAEDDKEAASGGRDDLEKTIPARCVSFFEIKKEENHNAGSGKGKK